MFRHEFGRAGWHPARWVISAALVLAALAAPPRAVGGEKVLILALEGPPESLDTAKSSSERANRVLWLLGDALLNISKDGKSLEPGLARSWTLSEDGLQAVFTLRAGVMFHDGTILDARAVKDNFERQFRPNHPLYTEDPKNSKEQLLASLIVGIEARDDLTLAFTLKYPGLHYLSQVEIASPTALAKLGRDFARAPVYTGPFRFDRWEKDRLVLVANPRYWAGRPKLDRAVFQFIPDGEALVEAMLKQEVDFSPALPEPTLFERLRDDPRITLVQVPGLNVFYLGFYTERPPFSNPLLRRAVAQAVNVERAAQALGRGVALPAKGPLSPAMLGHDPSVSQAAFDPRAARELVARAGGASGRTLRLVHSNATPFDVDLASSIRVDLRQIGITVQLLGKPGFAEMVQAVRAREGDMFVYSWHVRSPHPERLLQPLFHSKSAGTSNLTQYSNPKLDRLLDDVLMVPEGAARAKLYSQIQKTIVDDAPMVFLYHSTRMAAHADRVTGLELNLGALPQDKLVKVDLAP
jgi:peptide/nickel transport system substrate-binding protein